MLDLCGRGTGAAVDLPHGLRAEVRYGWIEFSDKNAVQQADSECGAELFTEVCPGNEYYAAGVDRKIGVRIEDRSYTPRINETRADWGKLGGEKLVMRNRRRGDRMVCFADGRTKKIKNVFIDAKIPREDREKIPLLCTGSEVVAIIGGRVSDKYKVNKDTERVLVIEYGTDR